MKLDCLRNFGLQRGGLVIVDAPEDTCVKSGGRWSLKVVLNTYYCFNLCWRASFHVDLVGNNEAVKSCQEFIEFKHCEINLTTLGISGFCT